MFLVRVRLYDFNLTGTKEGFFLYVWNASFWLFILTKQMYDVCMGQKYSPCSEVLLSHFDPGKC